MPFQIGDSIIMKENAPYAYTKYKSTGVVKAVNSTQVLVEFDFLTGEIPLTIGYVWWVLKEYCEVTKPLTQQERVCIKIKQMEARWLKFQQKLSQQKEGCHV